MEKQPGSLCGGEGTALSTWEDGIAMSWNGAACAKAGDGEKSPREET